MSSPQPLGSNHLAHQPVELPDTPATPTRSRPRHRARSPEADWVDATDLKFEFASPKPRKPRIGFEVTLTEDGAIPIPSRTGSRRIPRSARSRGRYRNSPSEGKSPMTERVMNELEKNQQNIDNARRIIKDLELALTPSKSKKNQIHAQLVALIKNQMNMTDEFSKLCTRKVHSKERQIQALEEELVNTKQQLIAFGTDEETEKDRILKHRISALTHELDETRQHLSHALDIQNELRSERDILASDLARAEEELRACQQENADLNSIKIVLESEKKANRFQLNRIVKKCEELSQGNDELIKRKKDLEYQLGRAEDAKKKAENNRNQARKELGKIKAELSLAKEEQNLLRQEKERLMSLYTSNAHAQSLQGANQNANTTIAQLTNDLAEYRTLLSQSTAAQKEQETLMAQLQDERSGIANKLKEAKQTCNNLAAAMTTLQRQKDQLEEQLINTQTQLQEQNELETSSLSPQPSSLDEQSSALQEQIDDLSQQLKDVSNERDALVQREDEVLNKLASVDQLISEHTAEQDQWAQEKLKWQQRVEETADLWKSTRQQLEEAAKGRTEYESQVASLQAENKSLVDKLAESTPSSEDNSSSSSSSVDSDSFAKEIESLNQKLRVAEQSVEELESRRDDLQALKEAAELSVQELQAEKQTHLRQLTETQTKLEELQAEHASANAINQTHIEQAAILNIQLKQAKEETQQALEQKVQIEVLLEECQLKLKEQAAEQDEKSLNETSATNGSGDDQVADELKQLKKDYETLTSKHETIQAELKSAQNHSNRLAKQLAKAKENVAQGEDLRVQLENVVESKNGLVKAKQAELKTSEKQAAKLKKKLMKLQEQYEKLTKYKSPVVDNSPKSARATDAVDDGKSVQLAADLKMIKVNLAKMKEERDVARQAGSQHEKLIDELMTEKTDYESKLGDISDQLTRKETELKEVLSKLAKLENDHTSKPISSSSSTVVTVFLLCLKLAFWCGILFALAAVAQTGYENRAHWRYYVQTSGRCVMAQPPLNPCPWNQWIDDGYSWLHYGQWGDIIPNFVQSSLCSLPGDASSSHSSSTPSESCPVMDMDQYVQKSTYKDLQDEISILETNWQTSVAEFKTRSDTCQTELITYQTELITVQTRLEDNQNELTTLQSQLNDNQEELTKFQIQLEENQQELTVIQTQLEECKTSEPEPAQYSAPSEDVIQVSREEYAVYQQLQEQLTHHEQEKQICREERDALSDQYAQCQIEMDQQGQEYLNKGTFQNGQANAQAQEIRKLSDKVNSCSKELSSRLGQLEFRIGSVTKWRQEALQGLQKEQARDQCKTRMDQLESFHVDEMASCRSESIQCDSLLTELNEKLQETASAYTNTASEIDTLTQMLEAANSKESICGELSNRLHETEHKFDDYRGWHDNMVLQQTKALIKEKAAACQSELSSKQVEIDQLKSSLTQATNERTQCEERETLCRNFGADQSQRLSSALSRVDNIEQRVEIHDEELQTLSELTSKCTTDAHQQSELLDQLNTESGRCKADLEYHEDFVHVLFTKIETLESTQAAAQKGRLRCSSDLSSRLDVVEAKLLQIVENDQIQGDNTSTRIAELEQSVLDSQNQAEERLQSAKAKCDQVTSLIASDQERCQTALAERVQSIEFRLSNLLSEYDAIQKEREVDTEILNDLLDRLQVGEEAEDSLKELSIKCQTDLSARVQLIEDRMNIILTKCNQDRALLEEDESITEELFQLAEEQQIKVTELEAALQQCHANEKEQAAVVFDADGNENTVAQVEAVECEECVCNCTCIDQNQQFAECEQERQSEQEQSHQLNQQLLTCEAGLTKNDEISSNYMDNVKTELGSIKAELIQFVTDHNQERGALQEQLDQLMEENRVLASQLTEAAKNIDTNDESNDPNVPATCPPCPVSNKNQGKELEGEENSAACDCQSLSDRLAQAEQDKKICLSDGLVLQGEGEDQKQGVSLDSQVLRYRELRMELMNEKIAEKKAKDAAEKKVANLEQEISNHLQQIEELSILISNQSSDNTMAELLVSKDNNDEDNFSADIDIELVHSQLQSIVDVNTTQRLALQTLVDSKIESLEIQVSEALASLSVLANILSPDTLETITEDATVENNTFSFSSASGYVDGLENEEDRQEDTQTRATIGLAERIHQFMLPLTQQVKTWIQEYYHSGSRGYKMGMLVAVALFDVVMYQTLLPSSRFMIFVTALAWVVLTYLCMLENQSLCLLLSAANSMLGFIFVLNPALIHRVAFSNGMLFFGKQPSVTPRLSKKL